MNVLTYKALDIVDYNNLVVETNEGRKLDGIVQGITAARPAARPNPDTLVDIVAKQVVWNEPLLCEALDTVPFHLVHSLLRAAIKV